jgi:WD40 repeat protein
LEKKDKTTCPVNHVSYSGTHLVTSCDKNAIVYEIGQNYKEFKVCEGPDSILKMECAPADIPIIPICYNNHEVKLWVPTETSLLKTKKIDLELLNGDNKKQIGLINSISWSNQNQSFVTCSSSRVTLWKVLLKGPNVSNVSTVSTYKDSTLINRNDEFKLVAFVPHKYSLGDYMALVPKNSSIIYFYRCSSDEFLDMSTPTKRADFIVDTKHEISKERYIEKGITLLVFHPTKKLLVTCDKDNNVKIWSFENPADKKTLSDFNQDYFKEIRTIKVDSEVSSIAFNNNDLAIGCKNGKLIVWQELNPKK